MWYWQETAARIEQHDAARVRQPGNWVAYEDAVQDKLSEVYRGLRRGSKTSKVIIDYPDRQVEVDVATLKQKNLKTGYERPIFMVPYARLFGNQSLEHVSAAAQLAKDEPTTKMMWFWEENQHRINKHDSRLVPALWTGDIPANWVQYPIQVQTALSAAYKRCKSAVSKGHAVIYVSRDMAIMTQDEPWDYAIDVMKKTQTNGKTGHVRKIHLLTAVQP